MLNWVLYDVGLWCLLAALCFVFTTRPRPADGECAAIKCSVILSRRSAFSWTLPTRGLVPFALTASRHICLSEWLCALKRGIAHKKVCDLSRHYPSVDRFNSDSSFREPAMPGASIVPLTRRVQLDE